MVKRKAPTQSFSNPFQMADILVFDDETLHYMLASNAFGLTPQRLAYSLQQGPETVVRHIQQDLPAEQRSQFQQALNSSISTQEIEQARQSILNALFWELTYWKTPDLYEELTWGEKVHPGIFRLIESDLRGKTVLDIGAGSGRASLVSVRHGAQQVYAVEPSPGLRRILEQKLAHRSLSSRVCVLPGRFDAIPLANNSVDTALSCSAFTAKDQQGGEPGLRELQRVTRPGGKIILIWPRAEDREWLRQHGFHYVALPTRHSMHIHFRSLYSAIRCIKRFYAHNRAVLRYVLTTWTPEIPFSLLGMHPPRDYCWLEVQK